MITYDHTIWKARDPVRSPLVKPDRAGLVVGSVTTSESPVLYVFCPFFLLYCFSPLLVSSVFALFLFLFVFFCHFPFFLPLVYRESRRGSI